MKKRVTREADNGKRKTNLDVAEFGRLGETLRPVSKIGTTPTPVKIDLCRKRRNLASGGRKPPVITAA
jgi:hypothetical protein